MVSIPGRVRQLRAYPDRLGRGVFQKRVRDVFCTHIEIHGVLAANVTHENVV